MILWEIDWRDPIEAFAPLAGEADAHLLHGGDRSHAAEWSVIAAFPVAVIRAEKGGIDPFPKLNDILRARAQPRLDEMADLPFVSGALGFVGYEAARFFESCLDLPPSPFALPDAALGIYDAAALFSRVKRKAYVAGRNEAACRRLRDALGRDALAAPRPAQFGALASNFTGAAYRATVSEAIENILDGDYYQANLSHQLTASAGDAFPPFDLFRRLAGGSDAFHGAMLQYQEGAVLSNSPERFFRIEAGVYGRRRIVAEPIKGTRPRGKTTQEDLALASELLADAKDRAENIMIADLLRNDLSRICRDGSIREDAVCELMSLTNVHHLVSRISGVLCDDVNPAEIFAALFPCGSITGAPKIEAMKAIARIEKTGRGPYCGAIGYMDDSGAMDFAVAIRTLMVEGARVTMPVGGGVTLRSKPQDEYEETIVKARGALAALGRTDAAGVS
ncbi:anthranilate synthase component I family protein [Hyphococcus sp.]|uniref:anthranilate synthase component I family protein n=1 Tax=Hyphococcus sp. TaxID=2038636 RepID=UPI003D10D48A